MRKIITGFCVLLFSIILNAAPPPVPQKMSYQAVVRNSSNELLANKTIGMKISILYNTPTGTVVYAETQTPATNANGLISIAIGTGTVVDGSFTAIEWTQGPHFIKTEIDPAGGTAYSITSTSELLSVPYALAAMVARNAETISNNSVTSAKIADGTVGNADLGEMAVNSAKIQDGSITTTDLAGDIITTFKIEDGAVGNADLADGSVSFTKIADGAVAYAKISSMGAATGDVLKWNGTTWTHGTDNAGITLPYSGVVNTNVGFVVINESGIAIEGLATSTSNEGAGTGLMGESRMDGGTGVRALASAVTGTTYGVRAESKSSNGFGVQGKASHTTGNNYGVWGESNSSAGIGVVATNYSSTGTTYGVRGIVSSPAGYSGYFTGGQFYVNGKVGFGTNDPSAGLHLKGTAFPESFIFLQSAAGEDAGFRLYEGPTAKWHIYNNATAGGLDIYNNGVVNAIFLKQSNAYVGMGTTAPTVKLDVNGNARIRSIGSGAYTGVVNRTSDGTLTTATSDVRMKENIQTLTDGLDKIMQLRGVSFTWKSNPEYGTRVGLIAQEVEEVIPELVFTNPTDGYKGVNYAEMNAVLIEAVKEQQKLIRDLKDENDRLKTSSERNEARMTEIENMLRDLMKK